MYLEEGVCEDCHCCLESCMGRYCFEQVTMQWHLRLLSVELYTIEWLMLMHLCGVVVERKWIRFILVVSEWNWMQWVNALLGKCQFAKGIGRVEIFSGSCSSSTVIVSMSYSQVFRAFLIDVIHCYRYICTVHGTKEVGFVVWILEGCVLCAPNKARPHKIASVLQDMGSPNKNGTPMWPDVLMICL